MNNSDVIPAKAGIFSKRFLSLTQKIPLIGYKQHHDIILSQAKRNRANIKKSIKALSPPEGVKAASGIVISAGPSLHRKNSLKKIRNSNYQGTLIATDGAYLFCLREGLIPDYVITIDPHPTRIVRWFGDPDFERHIKNDDYYLRQGADLELRKNAINRNEENIRLVNEKGGLTKAIVASPAPENVVKRIKEAKFDAYGFNPLVDDPVKKRGLTRRLYGINPLPCMNTGGTVGVAAWVFASAILKLPQIALVGMDYSYYDDMPIEETQTYYELIHYVGSKDLLDDFFVEFSSFSCHPESKARGISSQKFYTDPLLFWYRQNFLALLPRSFSKTVNCTEGGILFDENMECIALSDFLRRSSELVNG